MKHIGYIEITSPWVLSAVPALAYAIAFLSRLGEAYARGIPTDWIVVSLTDALSRTATIGLVIVVLFVSSALEDSWKKRLPKWSHRAISNFADQLVPIALFLIIIGSVAISAGVLLVSAIVTLFMALQGYRKRGSHKSQPAKHEGVVVLEPAPEPGDVSSIRIRAGVVLAVVVAALMLAPLGGWGRAVLSSKVLVSSDGERIVAASYGSSAVLADLTVRDDGRWEVGSSREFVDLTARPVMTFESTNAPLPIEW